MSDLLPCPFCGGKARYQADHTTECRDSVWCGACDYGMFDPDEQGSVVSAWNRRAIPAPDARADALREAAAEVQRWFHDGSDNRDPAALILALISANSKTP